MWISGRVFQTFQPLHILAAAGVTSVLYVVTHLARLPISMMGIVAGISTPTPIGISLLVGGILGKVMTKLYGESWLRNRTTLAAGTSLGTVATITVLSAVMVLMKSLWSLPY